MHVSRGVRVQEGYTLEWRTRDWTNTHVRVFACLNRADKRLNYKSNRDMYSICVSSPACFYDLLSGSRWYGSFITTMPILFSSIYASKSAEDTQSLPQPPPLMDPMKPLNWKNQLDCTSKKQHFMKMHWRPFLPPALGAQNPIWPPVSDRGQREDFNSNTTSSSAIIILIVWYRKRKTSLLP